MLDKKFFTKSSHKIKKNSLSGYFIEGKNKKIMIKKILNQFLIRIQHP